MNAPRLPRSEGGFAIVGVLIFIGLIATLGATYMKHVLVESRTSLVAADAVDAREAVHSTLQVAHQAMLVGQDTSSMNQGALNKLAAMQMAEVGTDDHTSILAQSIDSDGLGSTVLAEAARIPLPVADHPDTLPRPDAAMLDMGGNRFVGEFGHEIGFPVMLHAFRDRTVEKTVEYGKRHDLDKFRLHVGGIA